MKIAYLINQYPKVSHSFIRREILALESQGITISRFSVRSCADQLVDVTDIEELKKTRFILDVGILGLIISLFRVVILNPVNFIQALVLTFKIGYLSDRGILLNFAYLAEACVLSFWLKKEQISHIHAHFGTNSTTVAMLCSILSDFTYSFTIHGPEEFDKPMAIALPEKIKRATFVVAISSYGKSQIYRWCDYKEWGKIHIIHCGLEEKFIQAEVTPIAEENRLVCVGRLCPQKAQLLLLTAVARLKEKGIECKIILVGDGELREEIEELSQKLGIKEQIEITGWASSDEVIQQISQAKLMVMPSFAEGLPVVIMESLALGKPVITTYVAGIPELIINGESGWLIPAGDIDALTVALESALSLPIEKIAQMGKKGKEKVTENHDIKKEAEKLNNLFEKYCKDFLQIVSKNS
ncbi:MAG: glycosyltransferase family 4 protein [Cyanobacteria bacterium]|nr:glycosyltransferase family 4 protein [Cyanobacteria bacterium CG_2015-16_32_12]NCO78476.1 glycosyltransferase family 4 protein [Cyanobacteria bacterium CG_2015-22_32_23]NCQ04254.1 glycosyltransferase family 4 protein [Cyanobacteria bacterium CG_2015-09_32_10]NCQ40443.1 glycosyltransferase family 4 protein [Cyanobacteria bacterium CG_2015-04_32_10]NCS83549.1 glycosyltransferase family 4 protein [Cyanobacteria bacterium CG_2015-02_32_10]